MTETEKAELRHRFICSTCGAEAQTGIKPHCAPDNGSRKPHALTVKAKNLRRGDTIRPVATMVPLIRISEIADEEHEGAEFIVVTLASGMSVIYGPDDDVNIVLRESWK